MPEEEQTASITASVVETNEATFKPPPFTGLPVEPDDGQPPITIDTEQATKSIFAVLEPQEKDDYTFYDPEWTYRYKSIEPPYIPEYIPLPDFEAPKKELVINIETTGVKPWESRLICIGVLDPNAMQPETINFIQETELETLQAFMDWFNAQTYETLIGYNVSFDYRFIYALLQKYRLNLPKWKDMKLHDLMQQQKQVKQEFVYGRNPEGKLEDWAEYLFGIPPYAPQEKIYFWLKEKNWDEIVNFNSDKLVKSYYLWVLDLVVAGAIPGQEVISRPSIQHSEEVMTPLQQFKTTASEEIEIACPNCLQKQSMAKTDKTIMCKVCNSVIANPML